MRTLEPCNHRVKPAIHHMSIPNDLDAAMTAWRRHLHANPEPSLHEKETAAFVSARLAELGIPHVTGVGGHGVVATLSRPGGDRAAYSPGPLR